MPFLYIVLAVIFASACPARNGDELAYLHLRRLAGNGAIDCGRVALGKDATSTNECALAAFRAKRPFFVRYEVQGRDSRLVVGFAVDDRTQATVVKHD
jgi:hypothetical protein